MNQENDNLFAGLRALSESTFPKTCSTCGKVYATPSQFVRETQALHKTSGLKSSFNDDDQSIVEVFRNCVCGSTLMSSFSDRRDTSPAALKRRDLFGRLMHLLIRKGISQDLARTELLNFIHGKPSALLKKIGIDKH